jgi:hypothetical protein
MSKLGGSILTAVGTLVAGGSGLCTLAVLDMGKGLANIDSFGLAVVGFFGGLPFLAGMIVLILGIRELRQSRREGDNLSPRPGNGDAPQ